MCIRSLIGNSAKKDCDAQKKIASEGNKFVRILKNEMNEEEMEIEGLDTEVSIESDIRALRFSQ